MAPLNCAADLPGACLIVASVRAIEAAFLPRPSYWPVRLDSAIGSPSLLQDVYSQEGPLDPRIAGTPLPLRGTALIETTSTSPSSSRISERPAMAKVHCRHFLLDYYRKAPLGKYGGIEVMVRASLSNSPRMRGLL